MSVPFSNTKLRVPRGFEALLEGFAREVLRAQPKCIIQFGAMHFSNLLKIRTGKFIFFILVLFKFYRKVFFVVFTFYMSLSWIFNFFIAFLFCFYFSIINWQNHLIYFSNFNLGFLPFLVFTFFFPNETS